MFRSSVPLLLALVFALQIPVTTWLPGTAQAEDPTQRRISRVTREFASRRLETASEYLAKENYEKALAQFRQIETSDRVNDYERALAFQGMGFVYSAMGDYAKSAGAFERIGSGILQPQAELNMLYNLGQLYVALDRTPDAIRTLERWFRYAKNPSPQAHIALANAYVQAERFDDALPLVTQACADASHAEESWLQLLVALHVQASRYADAVGVLEKLVERFPRKTYWSQLSSLYWELGRERDSLIALELAHIQVPLEDSSEVSRLANLLLQNQIPYKAAMVMERALAQGRTDATWRSYDLLATSLLQAREVGRALEPLAKAAAMSSDGKLWLRLAQLRIHREEWSEAEHALKQAEARGGLDELGTVALLTGIAQLNQGESENAQTAFQRARAYPETRRLATEYIAYLNELEIRKGTE